MLRENGILDYIIYSFINILFIAKINKIHISLYNTIAEEFLKILTIFFICINNNISSININFTQNKLIKNLEFIFINFTLFLNRNTLSATNLKFLDYLLFLCLYNIFRRKLKK